MMNEFNDGIAQIIKMKPIINGIGVKIGETPTVLGFPRFGIMSLRQQDMIFIEAGGRRLDMKIKIIMNHNVTSGMKAKIKEDTFDIVSVDHDKIMKKTYLYLQKV